MKYRRIKSKSKRGSLMAECDKLLSQIIRRERGDNCEIHNKICDRVGNMHILSKQAHPKLRFEKQNIIRAGWFCSHYWTHHNPDDSRAIFTIHRIKELRGENYKIDLLNIERYMNKHNELYLRARIQQLREELLDLDNIKISEYKEELDKLEA